jgi:ABC-type sugar transport system substrate-binding protein
MIKKSINIILLTLLACVFALSIVVLAEQKMESVTSSLGPLPVPRRVVDRPLVIGFQSGNMAYESSQRNYKQTQNEIGKRGWKLISNLDTTTPALQREGIENLINQNVDAIVVCYNQMEVIKDLIIKAREKGIGFYNIDTEVRDGVIINPTCANGVVGAQMAYYGINKLKERGNMLILTAESSQNPRRRCLPARALIDGDWPALTCVGFESMKIPGWDKDAFDITQNYLTKYNNDIQWVFAGWDTPGIFAARAIEEAGLTRKDCFVTGIDGGKQAYAEIRKGSPFIATMSEPFEQYTHITFEVIQQVQVDGIAPGEPGSIRPPDSAIIYVECVLTTPENVPAEGSSIHEVFKSTYYDPNDKEAWYFWGEPYRI